ncbi:MAG: histidine kinase dimerization/phospho-acceptor domain-containing protein [Chthoniobacterales bacterium]
MNFRLRMAVWFGISLAALTAVLMATAHWHLDEELRQDRWDRSHPKYPGWSIHGSFTNEEVHDILGELMKVWVWAGLPVLAVALGIGFLLARRSVRPIHAINRELSLLETKSLRKGIAVPENDVVLSDLVHHINRLLERVGDAYEKLDEFASKVSHELRTPLTLLRMKIERSAANLPTGLSEELQEELAHLTRLVEQSLLAAKAESGRINPNLQAVDFSALLDDVLEGYVLLAQERDLSIRCSVGTNLRVATDAELLRQILHNLLSNAVRYAHRRIQIRARPMHEYVSLTVTNDFDRRTMATAGTGLGLRLVRGLASALAINFRQRQNRAIFATRLQLPAGVSEAQAIHSGLRNAECGQAGSGQG